MILWQPRQSRQKKKKEGMNMIFCWFFPHVQACGSHSMALWVDPKLTKNKSHSTQPIQWFTLSFSFLYHLNSVVLASLWIHDSWLYGIRFVNRKADADWCGGETGTCEEICKSLVVNNVDPVTKNQLVYIYTHCNKNLLEFVGQFTS